MDECIKLVGEKYAELSFKHDGCRVLQALLKYGNRPQRILVIEKIKSHFVTLMNSKYSHYLASKAYFLAPVEERNGVQLVRKLLFATQRVFPEDQLMKLPKRIL